MWFQEEKKKQEIKLETAAEGNKQPQQAVQRKPQGYSFDLQRILEAPPEHQEQVQLKEFQVASLQHEIPHFKDIPPFWDNPLVKREFEGKPAKSAISKPDLKEESPKEAKPTPSVVKQLADSILRDDRTSELPRSSVYEFHPNITDDSVHLMNVDALKLVRNYKSYFVWVRWEIWIISRFDL